MTLFLLLSFIFMAIVAVSLAVGAGIDDIRTITRSRRHTRHSSPLVTILLTVDTDTVTTGQVLESIRQSSYQKFEIILMCPRTDRAKLQKIITQFPGEYTMNIFSGAPSWKNAYRRYGHGSIILTLSSHNLLHRSAIDRALWHFECQPNKAALYPNIVTIARYSSVGLLQMYINGIARLWKKATNTLMPSAPTSLLSSPAFYHKSALNGPRQSLPIDTYFADNVTIFTPAINDIRALMTALYRALVSNYTTLWQSRVGQPLLSVYRRFLVLCLGGLLLALPPLTTYALSLAIVARQPLLFFVILGAAGLYTLLSTWKATDLRYRQKAYLTAMLPAYLLPLLLSSFFYTFTLITLAVQHLQRGASQSAVNRKSPASLKIPSNMREAVIPRRISFLFRIKNR